MENFEEINTDHSGEPLKFKQKWPQYLAATMATMASLCAGCAIAWTSPVIERLEGLKGTYEPLSEPLTTNEASWVGSLMALGAILGPLCGGIFIDKFGRKNTFILIGGLPGIAGWICILAAQNPADLYVGRFLTGILTGTASTLGPVYIAEVSSASERGALCSMPQLMIALGIMVQYTVGPYVSYYVFAGVNLVFPILFAIGFFFMPESPYYLLAIGKREEAEASLVWFRGGGWGKERRASVDVTKELDRISMAIEESGIRDSNLMNSFKDLFSTPGNRRGFLVMSVLMFTLQFCGINAVLFNAESILRGGNEDSKSALTPSESAMIIGAVNIITAWVETILADRAGRRPLLLLSCALSALSLVALGVHSYLTVFDVSTAASLSWLPVSSLVIYNIAFGIGLGPLSWAVLRELFPNTCKSAAGIWSGCLSWTLGFVVTYTFESLVYAAGPYGVYWMYSGCCVVGFVFLYFLLPETKCKTLEQIQNELKGSGYRGVAQK